MHTGSRILFGDRIVVQDEAGTLQVKPALIEIESGRIKTINPCRREDLPFKLVFEDLGQQIVTPAFVNAHTHLCMIAFRGIGGLSSLKGNVVEDLYFKLEAKMTADDIAAFTRIGALEALMSGTGFVWDHYYHGFAIAKTLYEIGLCAGVAPTLQDLGGPGAARLDAAWENTFRIAESNELKAQGIFAVLGPHATDTVSDELWRRVREASMVWNLPVHCHIAQSIEEVERSWETHQCAPMTRMQRLGLCSLNASRLWVHGLWVSDSELDKLTSKDTLIHCPSAQMQFDFPAPTYPWRTRELPVMIGTDAPSCNDGINVQSELRIFASGQSYAISHNDPHRVFRETGTLEAAKAMRQSRQLLFQSYAELSRPQKILETVWSNGMNLHPHVKVGLLQEGALANLCVWNPEHPVFWPSDNLFHSLCFGNISPALNRIMTCGEWRIDGAGDLSSRIMRDPRSHAWMTEAKTRRKELLMRVGVI